MYDLNGDFNPEYINCNQTSDYLQVGIVSPNKKTKKPQAASTNIPNNNYKKHINQHIKQQAGINLNFNKTAGQDKKKRS